MSRNVDPHDGRSRKVFLFGTGVAPAPEMTVQLVGDKTFHLIKMAEAGLPVPPGFVLSTEFCTEYFDRGNTLPPDFDRALTTNISLLEKLSGRTFGGTSKPLLVSVRSGSPTSMPGTMHTILNVGLCEKTLSGFLSMTGNPKLLWDCYRRLIQTYAEVVYGCSPVSFEGLFVSHMQREQVTRASDLDAGTLKGITDKFKKQFEIETGAAFPEDAGAQLAAAAEAVFQSSRGPAVRDYRDLQKLDGYEPTSVTVQSMVFGNMGSRSGAGVVFSRNPATGEKRLCLDFLFNAQGEDVVSGRHPVRDSTAFAKIMPDTYRHIQPICDKLERLFKDAQDVEFTVEEGELFVLQSRSAKRTSWAALQIACDLVEEGIIDESAALGRLSGLDPSSIQLTRFSSEDKPVPLCRAVPASAGVSVGRIALDREKAEEMAARGLPVVLVRKELLASDLAGMAVADAILAMLGGHTSHAAVVARQLNKICVVGCHELEIDLQRRVCRVGAKIVPEGSCLSVDGGSGDIYEGRLKVVVEKPSANLDRIRTWKTV